MKKILLVEDDHPLSMMLKYLLQKDSYSVSCASSGEEALYFLKKDVPDLVLLDLNLPGIDGYEVCRFLRYNKLTENIIIIMLTSRNREDEIISGLTEYAADDYITKPFSKQELLARIGNEFRKRSCNELKSEKYELAGGVLIDAVAREVYVGELPVKLTNKEFNILEFLFNHRDKACAREDIIQSIYGRSMAVSAKNVDNAIYSIKKKIPELIRYIKPIHSYGYMFRSN